jgi:hypothetical protein
MGSLKQRVELIVKLLRADFYDPYRGPQLRALVGKITKACPTRTEAGERNAGFCELSSVCDWVATNVRYSGDTHPIGEKPVDLYQSPWRSVEMGIADCDDQAPLTVALVTYLGYHAWLRIMSASGDSWDHIYCVVDFPRVNPDRILVVDPTLGIGKCGIEAPYAKYVDFYR